MKGSYDSMDSQQVVVLQLWFGQTTDCEKIACYEMLHRALNLDGQGIQHACTRETVSAYKMLIQNEKGRDHSEDQGIYGMDIRETGHEGVDWMHMAWFRDQWHTLVNTVMNFWAP
jgi:hypothetical protein